MQTSLSEPPLSIVRLRNTLRGRVITPDDPVYARARTVFDRSIDRRPAVIARVADATDVARVVSLAREARLELAIRSGGHSLAGHGVCDGGIVLDLADMRALQIDRQQRTAWAQTGVTTGAYTAAAAADGLATPFGDTGSVGIGGITLGGGIGYLVRKHGLTIDDLLAAEVVTADGRLLYADAETHPDLFWAIRGGGGNFGVVTRCKFRLHPVDRVVGGALILPATPDNITSFVAEAAAAPDELSTIANVLPAPPLPFVPAHEHGRLVIMAMLVHAGAVEDGERAVAPFRRLATPLADLVRPMRYVEMFQPGDPDIRPTAVTRTMFVDALDRKRGRDTPRAPPGLRRDDTSGAAPGPGWGHGRRARRRHRVRPPREPDHGEHRRVLPGHGRPGRARGMGCRRRGGAAPERHRRLRQLHRRRGSGTGPRRVPGFNVGSTRRDQDALRPDQPLPAEPKHPAADRRHPGAPPRRWNTAKRGSRRTAAPSN
jgi:hypothetical protein